MRTFSGEKLFVGGEVGRIQIRATSIPSFYPVFSTAKPVRRMVSTSENRSQEIEKSFAAERKIVWRRLYRHSVSAFSRKEWHGSRITPFKFARRL